MTNIGMAAKAFLALFVALGVGMGASYALAKPDLAKSQKMVHVSESGEARVGGTVSGISGSNISLASWLGTWVVDVSDAKMNVESLSQVKAGDKLVAFGKLVSSGLSLTASTIHDFSFKGKEDGDKEGKKRRIKGTIEDLNAGNGTFTLETKHRGDIKVETTGDTKVFFPRHVAGAVGGLANGMKAMVTGMLDVSAKTMAAFSIHAKR